MRVWSSVDWMLCGVIDQHTGCVRSLTFNPTDGNQMITGASDRPPPAPHPRDGIAI